MIRRRGYVLCTTLHAFAARFTTLRAPLLPIHSAPPAAHTHTHTQTRPPLLAHPSADRSRVIVTTRGCLVTGLMWAAASYYGFSARREIRAAAESVSGRGEESVVGRGSALILALPARSQLPVHPRRYRIYIYNAHNTRIRPMRARPNFTVDEKSLFTVPTPSTASSRGVEIL